MNSLQFEQALESIDLDIYFSILKRIIQADKILHGEQMEYLQDQAELLSYDLDKLEKNLETLEEIDWNNTSNITKNIIIRDCIIMAYSNGEYHEDEAKAIRNIAEKIGIKERKVDDIELWLKDYREVLKRAELVLLQS